MAWIETYPFALRSTLTPIEAASLTDGAGVAYRPLSAIHERDPGMVENVIRTLITIACAVLCYFLVVWVLGMLGVHLPAMVMQVLAVILVLIVLLFLWRSFGSSLRL